MFKGVVIFRDLGFQLTKGQRSVLRLILITTFIYMLADYSTYSIPYIGVYLMLASILVISTLNRSMIDVRERNKVRPLFYAAFLIYFVIALIIHGEKPSVGIVCAVVMGYYVLSLKTKYKVWLFDRFTSLLAIAFGLSALEYILAVFFGISHINYTPIYRFETDANFFYQGIITLFPSYYQTGFARFQAFTEEPGLVGTLCAFILACLDIKHNKWQLVVFIICGVLSMSLAFYLMFALWLIYNALNLKNIKYNIFLFAFIILMVFFTQDVIAEIIGGRIAETGSIAELDNRGSDAFKKAFNEFLFSSDAFFGCGLRTFHAIFDRVGYSGNAGAKPFIYSFGLFSMFLLFITYTRSFLKVNGRNRKALFILLVFWLSFYQRDVWYTPYNIIPIFMYGAYDMYMKQMNLCISRK